MRTYANIDALIGEFDDSMEYKALGKNTALSADEKELIWRIVQFLYFSGKPHIRDLTTKPS